jgi:hypothetical protein
MPTLESLYETRTLKRLQIFLSYPVGNLPHSWRDEIAEIADSLSPAELAIYGRRIIHFFLRIERAKKSNTQICEQPQNAAPWALAGKRNRNKSPRLGGGDAAVFHPFPAWLPTASESGGV